MSSTKGVQFDGPLHFCWHVYNGGRILQQQYYGSDLVLTILISLLLSQKYC